MTNSAKPTGEHADFLACLRKHEVLVGVHALAFHAKPRYTSNLEVFVMAPEDFEGDALGLGHEPNRIDILTRISGVTFDEAWGNRVQGTYAGEDVFFIEKDELLRNKEASGRAQDLADAELLRRFL